MPFLDALTVGYVQLTWTDFYIERDGGFHLPITPQMVGQRAAKHVPSFDQEHYPIEFIWFRPFIPKTPDGYSVLTMHPLNRFDLPFTTLAGVTDSDKLHHSANGQIPFYVKRGFSGLIPKGTPMFQIIPFKRDAWVSAVREFDQDAMDAKQRERYSVFWHFYKDKFWQRKSYE